jgi:ElaB/YqjD/DUF883 family membrane-anchored ribosome-binding protein
MVGTLFQLVGIDLQRQLASLKSQAEEFKHRTTNEVKRQIAYASITIGIAFVGLVLGLLTVIAGLIALYLWVAMLHGPFAALAVVGCITAILAALLFTVVATRSRLTPSNRPLNNAAQTTSPSTESSSYCASPSASFVDTIKQDLLDRTAAATNDALDSAAELVRKSPREVIVATLAIAVLIGIVIGRRG